jgi:quercetin dioxygenase-like cupin family protein
MNRRCVRLGAAGLAAAALVCGTAALIAAADAVKTPLLVSFADLKWVALPERADTQYAALSGDPALGPYTRMRRVPAGTDNPLHSHSSEITNVIISGVLYTGTDKASAKDFGPGSVVMLPADWVHVSGCRAGAECVFYQDGKGKFDYKPSAPPAK